jgi:hypothetical protein
MNKRNLTIGGIAATLAIVGTVVISKTDHTQAVPEVTQTQFMTLPGDLRDYRYCEIIPIFRSRATLYVEVYNTLSLNKCPAELWNALDEETLKKEYGAMAVRINGPRYWVLNEMEGRGATAEGKTADFGGIEMTQRAILESKIWKGTVGDASYTANEVQRTTTFTYYAGNMVYELTSPDGDVYRMQSYSQAKDPALTIEDLESLGERLDMPEGWSYQARVLGETSELKADGLAVVVTDEFQNTYQKAAP